MPLLRGKIFQGGLYEALVSFICAGLLFGSSLVGAEVSKNSLQSADSQFLFGADAQEVKVAILSEQELQETQGAWWWVVIPVAVTGTSCLINGWKSCSGIKTSTPPIKF